MSRPTQTTLNGPPQDLKDSVNTDGQKLDLDEIRSRFSELPTAPDQVFLELSNPPRYTAVPNLYLEHFIKSLPSNEERRPSTQPFTEDLVVGKNDPLYFAHYYSTKVPPEAIKTFLLHYTQPGDVIFDGFCGTGMTGVAAQLCALDHGERGGKRNAILVDLSPAATFISHVTNELGHLINRLGIIEKIVDSVEDEHQELLHTNHNGWPRGTHEPSLRTNSSRSSSKGQIQYVVWSDVVTCPSCQQQHTYWDLGFQGPKKAVSKTVHCHSCDNKFTLVEAPRMPETRLDRELGEKIEQSTTVPVLINYKVGSKRFEKIPDDEDLEILRSISGPLPFPVPLEKMPDGVNTAQPARSHGYSHVHHFFTRRNLSMLGSMWEKVNGLRDDDRRLGLYLLTGSIQRVCRMNRYMPNHDRHVGPLSGTLYVGPLTAEIPVTNYIRSRIKDLRRCSRPPSPESIRVSTQSSTDLSNIPDESIDYIFTDPPFGGNINYSELNVLVEAWLGVVTNNAQESIINDIQGKDMKDYQVLMKQCFGEFHRILKSGRWITVEFSNSSNQVWATIQEALSQVGFVVADVRTFDKTKGTTKQLTFTTTVKKDLLISAYKPGREIAESISGIKEIDGEAVWQFIRSHLAKLPVSIRSKDGIEPVAERLHHTLFDRLLSYFLVRGVRIPISSWDFLTGLQDRFPNREGMFFLPEQVAQYDRTLLTGTVQQVLPLIVDERTAIAWLNLRLRESPSAFSSLQPDYMNASQHWRKSESVRELIDLLDENFVEDEANRWKIADPSKKKELEQIRQKRLLQRFKTIAEGTGKITPLPSEVLLAGFQDCWSKQSFKQILQVGKRIPTKALEENQQLSMMVSLAKKMVEN